MRRAFAVIALQLLVLAGPAAAANITIACGAVGKELDFCREGAEAWAKQSGNTIQVISTPNQSEERLAIYQQLLAAQSDQLDVLQVDVIWPGILGDHFVDLAPHVPDDVRENYFGAIVTNNTVDGRLVAMPWFADVGLLYYRKDLLQKHGVAAPSTWEELTDTAKRIQAAERDSGNDRMWGFVFQARAYEGLTCNALEWVHSYGGGGLINLDGEITIDNEHAADALGLARSWIGTIAPKGVLNYAEEESRGVFQSGNAVFMRNWPYAWALANAGGSPIAGKVGLAPLPGSQYGKSSGVLGGSQLSVSKYSRHPEVAIELVLYLTAAKEQKRRAIEGSFIPTIPNLYDDPDILAANPSFQTVRDALEQAVARPSRVTGPAYNRVSSAFWNTTHGILSGDGKVETSLARLERRLQRIRGDGWE